MSTKPPMALSLIEKLEEIARAFAAISVAYEVLFSSAHPMAGYANQPVHQKAMKGLNLIEGLTLQLRQQPSEQVNVVRYNLQKIATGCDSTFCKDAAKKAIAALDNQSSPTGKEISLSILAHSIARRMSHLSPMEIAKMALEDQDIKHVD